MIRPRQRITRHIALGDTAIRKVTVSRHSMGSPHTLGRAKAETNRELVDIHPLLGPRKDRGWTKDRGSRQGSRELMGRNQFQIGW